ncbi:MAG: hypothetical protein M1378_01215 [Bacteroidetes bacterium]|nr:hypothetical protein [Bacteroidota bacterium]
MAQQKTKSIIGKTVESITEHAVSLGDGKPVRDLSNIRFTDGTTLTLGSINKNDPQESDDTPRYVVASVTSKGRQANERDTFQVVRTTAGDRSVGIPDLYAEATLTIDKDVIPPEERAEFYEGLRDYLKSWLDGGTGHQRGHLKTKKGD